jgi:hypothetical protein
MMDIKNTALHCSRTEFEKSGRPFLSLGRLPSAPKPQPRAARRLTMLLRRISRLHARSALASASASASASTSATVDLLALRRKAAADIDKLVEVRQANRFLQQLRDQACPAPRTTDLGAAGMTPAELRRIVTAGFMTFLTHVESRTASALGQGFYTIGPCGEELTAALGLLLRDTDAMALHYRHLAAQVARQLRAGRSTADILLDRARGHVVSLHDPISSGGHCLIGGGSHDFLVTSTLASQCPPAVGRAMGSALGAAAIPSSRLAVY